MGQNKFYNPWGDPGASPLDSERNFEPDPGLHGPQINFLKPFQTLFKHFLAKLGFHVGKFFGKIEFLAAPLAKVPIGK